MAILIMDGFDDYNYSPYRWTYAIDPLFGYTYSNVGTGIYSYGRYIDNVGGPFYRGPERTSAVASFHFLGGTNAGFWTAPGTADPYFHLSNVVTGKKGLACYILGTGQIQIRSYLDLFVPGPILATSTKQLEPGKWYWLSMRWDIGASGRFQFYANGELFMDFNGDTRGETSEPKFTDVRILRGTPSGFFFIDNMFVCDTTGPGPFNDIMPETRIYTLLPNAAGSLTEFTPVGDPSNFENVNPNPPIKPPPLVAYNESSTPGNRDLFQFDNVAFAGIPVVKAVSISLLAAKSDAGVRQVAPLVWDGVSLSSGAAVTLNAAWSGYQTVFLTNPATGLPWGFTDINNYEFGYQLVA